MTAYLIRRIITALMLVPSIGAAQDRALGMAAYEAGDYATAVKEWRSLAESGDARSQALIGNMYHSGLGVPQNYVEAFNWHKKAAEQGLTISERVLGEMYSTGQGTIKDNTEAVKWLSKAAEQGDAKAQKRLSLIYQYGGGIEDKAKALSWLTKAAKQGDAQAQSNLGYQYGFGIDVPQDFITGHMWSNLAAANGYLDAVKHRKAFASVMTPADISEAQRRATVCIESRYADCD